MSPADKTPPEGVPPDATPTGVTPTDVTPAEEAAPGRHEATEPRRRLHGPHASAAVIGLLTLLLGFAIAVQVHANSSSDSLSGLREDDLIGILDNQNARADRLRVQISQLQGTLTRLRDSGDKSVAARQQAAQEAQALGVLLGTVAARGPGVEVTVTDPGRKLTGEDLLDVVQELRGAGAEAIQFGDVRVSTTTWFQGSGGSVTVDGRTLTAPYRVLAIGEARTLNTALNIPGGVAASVRTAGGELSVVEHTALAITATRPLTAPKYAKPGH